MIAHHERCSRFLFFSKSFPTLGELGYSKTASAWGAPSSQSTPPVISKGELHVPDPDCRLYRRPSIRRQRLRLECRIKHQGADQPNERHGRSGPEKRRSEDQGDRKQAQGTP